MTMINGGGGGDECGDDDDDDDDDVIVTFAGCSLMQRGSVWLAEGGAGRNLSISSF